MLEGIQDVYYMLAHSEGFLNDVLEQASEMREACEVWEKVSRAEAFQHLPMMLKCKSTGEIAEVARLEVADLERPASVIPINRCAEILVPAIYGAQPRRHTAVR
jgi:hypothetical protein